MALFRTDLEALIILVITIVGFYFLNKFISSILKKNQKIPLKEKIIINFALKIITLMVVIFFIIEGFPAFTLIDPTYTVNPTCNYYFMVTSTFLILITGTWITERIIEPRMGKFKSDVEKEELQRLTALEKRGIKYAGIVFIALTII